jgi:leucyl-tRNA synthetase
MAVPAHDSRDYEFATAFSLPIRAVVEAPSTSSSASSSSSSALPYTDEGRNVNSASSFVSLDGLGTADAKAAVIAALEKGGKGKKKVRAPDCCG